MTITDLRWLLFKYDTTKVALYWLCFGISFLLLVLLTLAWPAAALFLLKTVEPISNLVKEVFWMFVPQEGQFIRKAGAIFGWLGRRAVSGLGERGQVIVQVGLLNGLILVSIAAWVARAFLMRVVRRRFIEQLLRDH